MSVDKLTEELGEAVKALNASRTANENNLKKYDALHEETQRKANETLENIIELKTRLDGIEQASKRAQVAIEEKNAPDELKKIFVDFIRHGGIGKGGQDEFAHLVRQAVETKTLQAQVDTDGGYVVSSMLGELIVARQFETSPIRQLAEVVTISESVLEFPVDNSEATSGGWVGERATRSATNTPTFIWQRIPVHEQYASPQATQIFLEDSFVDVESFISQKGADILSRTENTAFVSGNGVAKPRGFLDYSAWSVAGTYEANAIEQVNSGSAGAFTADGLIDLQNSLLESYQANASWVTRRQSFGSIMKLKYGSGEYIFNVNMRNAGMAFEILGRPLIFAADMPAVASDALAMAYGDFRRAYKIVDRVGLSILRDPFTNKGLVEFYMRKRVGGDIQNFEAIKIQKLAA